MIRMTLKLAPCALLILLVPLLAACNDMKETVGLGRNVPDEFDVVSNPPLTLPPDYSLRPPQRGGTAAAAAVPARTVAAQAAGAPIPVAASTTPGLAAFLTEAKAADAKPDIRATIDKESDGVVVKDKSFVDKLMVWQNQPKALDPTVNETAEAARVKAAQEKGAPISGEGAAVNKPKPQAPLEGLF